MLSKVEQSVNLGNLRPKEATNAKIILNYKLYLLKAVEVARARTPAEP